MTRKGIMIAMSIFALLFFSAWWFEGKSEQHFHIQELKMRDNIEVLETEFKIDRPFGSREYIRIR